MAAHSIIRTALYAGISTANNGQSPEDAVARTEGVLRAEGLDRRRRIRRFGNLRCEGSSFRDLIVSQLQNASPVPMFLVLREDSRARPTEAIPRNTAGRVLPFCLNIGLIAGIPQ